MSPLTDRPASEPDDGLSRRSLLGRSATGLGIVLAGNVRGLFGADAIAKRAQL